MPTSYQIDEIEFDLVGECVVKNSMAVRVI